MRGMAREYAAGDSRDRGGTSLRDLRLSGGWVGRRRCRQAGSGMARLPGQGAAELLSPRPAIRKMQGQPACRAGEPSGQGEEPPPEGLGGGYPLSQTDPRRPAGQQVVGHRQGRPARLACWRRSGPRGDGTSSDAVLEVAYGILDGRRGRRWSASSSSNSPSRSVMKP